MGAMRHSTDKAKDMARSILPSRWRGAPRARALLHRAERRSCRQALQAVRDGGLDWDEGVAFEDGRGELGAFVSRRRAGDKLNHFERWAVERTRALPRDHRLGHLKSLLPDGLIGQHAMLHLKQRGELAPERDDVRAWQFKVVRRAHFLDRGHVAQLLREVLEVKDGVRWLHRAMKGAVREVVARHRVAVAFRPLRGSADVRAFVAWLVTEPAARHVVDVFLRAWLELGRDPERACARAQPKAVLPSGEFSYQLR